MHARPPDEYQERARLAAESQELARDYNARLGRVARLALLGGAGLVLFMWLAWMLATWPLPASIERNPVTEEMREHLFRSP